MWDESQGSQSNMFDFVVIAHNDDNDMLMTDKLRFMVAISLDSANQAELG